MVLKYEDGRYTVAPELRLKAGWNWFAMVQRIYGGEVRREASWVRRVRLGGREPVELTSRTVCQGTWVRDGSGVDSCGDASSMTPMGGGVVRLVRTRRSALAVTAV